MGLTKPITMDPNYLVTSENIKVGVIKNGTVQPVSDWIPTSRKMLNFVK